MVLFNYATRELTAKIVYYGAGLCGKTTNLEHIHESLPEKTRGKMLSLATQTDRTLFFDFLPLDLGSVRGMKTRVQLYTVPGQVFYDATRKLVLKGADGVVFVVDSQNELLESNLESWENLKQNLKENSLDINTIPLVIQYNKRDLPNVLPVKDLDKKINVLKVPCFEAIAINGSGVQETLKGVAKMVLQNLSRKYAKREPEPSEVVEAAPRPVLQTVPLQEKPVAAAKALPTDETLDLSVLDEEVKELPNVEELESAEDVPLQLEPVVSIEESASIGHLEEVPELQEVPEILQPSEEAHELEEVGEEVREEELAGPELRMDTEGVTAQDMAELEKEAEAGENREDVVPWPGETRETGRESREKRQMPPIEKLVASLRTITIPAAAEKGKQRGQKKQQPQVEEPMQVQPAITSGGAVMQEIPIEINVSREGQDIKLQISIHLKIRVQSD